MPYDTTTYTYRYAAGDDTKGATHLARDTEGDVLVTLSEDLALCSMAGDGCGGLVALCVDGYSATCDVHSIEYGFALPVLLGA